MRTWTRATRVRFCGGCNAQIAKGAPMQRITLPNVRQEHIRCEACAGPAPPDLPTHIERYPPLTMERLGVLPLDWSKRRLGEREPGEDD